MPFKIIREDITKLNTDAIVNAANCYLKQGGGVCGAIFSAAGSEKLQSACDKIGFCNTGSAVITKGFNLSAKYIIHTVGPIYEKGSPNQAQELYSCYETSLNLAKKHKLKSIAFPLISSGIYGYPKQEALAIATKAILDFLSQNDMEIYLVVYDRASFTASEKLFKDVESYISDNMIIEEYSRTRLEYNMPCAMFGSVSTEKSSAPTQVLDDIIFPPAQTFSQKLFSIIDKKGISDVEVYKRANIDRKLFSKMRKVDYVPKKITVMALVIALELDMDEAKDLLALAGFAFSPASKFDLIIQYFIERKTYDIYQINEILFDFKQPLLGA